MKAGDAAGAAQLFARAVALAPQAFEFRLNLAIARNAQRRYAEALEALAPIAQQGRANPAYCSTRGTAERGLGRLEEAARWYDAALALDPGRAKALQGRARVALERDEADALASFDAALAVNPGDADLWLGKAQMLDALGDSQGARTIAQQLVDQAPHWADGLKLLAELRLAFPEIAHFALFEAVYAGAAGDDATAESRFSEVAIDSENRWTQEGRHALRLGQYDRAERAFERALAIDPQSIGAWALRSIGWRLTSDPRADWLHQQAGLVQMVALPDGEAVLAETVPLLHSLHDRSAFPLGQSLRGGTQTRGGLFDRTEPQLARLQASILQAIETYRANLPPSEDSEHPLLRFSQSPWRIKGSWSVRLAAGGDHHTAHIHPQGIVSSALYCDLPPDLAAQDNKAGWLELGRPPPDLRIDLPPLRVIEPRLGHLALFPSTLYHGTRPFAQGQRMSVAFDVVAGAH